MIGKFPSIKHYREVIKEYRKLGYYGDVELVGFPKGHGSNARVVFLSPEEVVGRSHPRTLGSMLNYVALGVDTSRGTPSGDNRCRTGTPEWG